MKSGLKISILIFGLIIIASMGLFSKFLNETNNQKNKSKEVIKHQEEWDFCLTNVDNKLSSIYLDLGLKKIAPLDNQPNVIWISIKMNNPREDGLSSTEESSKLYEIEDSLVNELTTRFDITYVGRLTSDNRRELYFYIGEHTLYDKAISEKMVLFPNYRYDYGIKEDKEWSGYLNYLYPSPRQLQSMMNLRVITQLEEGGDKLVKPREVDHWIYFKTDSDKNEFLDKIENDGFSIVDDDFDESFGDLPYRLHIKRIDKVDQNSVDVYVLYLWDLANETNGDYDGWETSIEKE